MAGLSEGVILIGQDARILGLNPAAERLFGYDPDELVGQASSVVLPVDVSRWFGDPDPNVVLLEHSDFIEGQELTGRRKDGTAFPFILNLAKTDHEDEVVLVAAVRDISHHRAAEEAIRQLSLTDPLTSLANRNLFHLRLEDAVNQAGRRGQLVALMLMDLDGFGTINDNFGHAVGDALLQEVATRLKGITRKTDTVARLDGDGFGVISVDLNSKEACHGLAQRIVDTLSEPVILDGCLLQTGASMGVSFFPVDDTHDDELIRKAGLALEEAKRAGPGCYRVYEQELDVRARSAKVLKMDLRLALVRDEFELYFQPMVNIDCREVVAAEALIRWQHPGRGMVSPSEFIPIAESSEFMLSLGDWVLRQACTQNKAWQNAGLPGLRVAVNISARHFQDGEFVPKLRSILNETRLDAHWLELEITEGMVMHDTEQVIKKFLEINNLGVEISIDDFGTGYSSLAYLKRFPVQRLKIDQSFVRDLNVDADDAAITEAVIKMGHSLNLKVVAEGVETERQMAFLRDKGCDELQGYLFSQPLPAEQFAAWHEDWTRVKLASDGPICGPQPQPLAS